MNALTRYLQPQKQTNGERMARFKRNEDGFLNTDKMLSAAGFVLGVVITAVLAIIILSALAPVYIPAVKNLSQNVSTGDFGNATANSLTGVFSLIISLFGLFALVGLAAVALVVHYKKKGGI